MAAILLLAELCDRRVHICHVARQSEVSASCLVIDMRSSRHQAVLSCKNISTLVSPCIESVDQLVIIFAGPLGRTV